MKLERKVLLDALELAKPALSTKNVLPELTNFWFDGDTVTAFNDISLGIQVPFKSELRGGIVGSLLLGILSNSRAKEVELLIEGEDAELRAGKTRLKLALLPPSRALWHFPEHGKGKGALLSRGLLEALKASILSAGSGTTEPEQLGVTIYGDGKQVHLFTTDVRSVTWKSAVDSHDEWKDKRLIMPIEFVEQILKQANDKTRLFIGKDGLIAIRDGLKIFARSIESKNPRDFEKMLKDILKSATPVPTPLRLRLALERACVMLDGHKNETMRVSIEDKLLILDAKTPFGELHDSMALEKAVPEVSFNVMPDLIKRGLEYTDRIGFSNHSLIMIGDHMMYAIGATKSES